MPFLNATLWNNIQESQATNDNRFSEVGLIDATKESTASTNYIPPSAKAALNTTNSLRQVEIPVLKDREVTVVQTPGFEFIPSNLPETDKYNFTAVDVFSGFRHYTAAYANNMVDAEYARQQTMLDVSYECANTIEGLLATQYEARKSQVLDFTTQISQGDGTYTFDAPSDTLQINKAAQKETMFYNLAALMRANELPGDYRVVTNRAGLQVQKSEALKFGAQNQTNIDQLLRAGQMPMERMHETGNITAGADNFNGWLLRDGSIGMIENFPYDFANGTEINGRKWSISDVELPFTRMRANIYTNSVATNADALITSGSDSNLIMTAFEEMAIWFRFYIVYRYNTDISTRANDIVKIQGLTT